MRRARVRDLDVTLCRATVADVVPIAALRTSVARELTRHFGRGHWSSGGTEAGVLMDLKTPGLFVVRQSGRIVATLRLAPKKPWAIDPASFTPRVRPLYLTSMAVEPAAQRLGIGRRCMAEACRIAREWPADAIRLDAYDAEAGAGPFYVKCGFSEVGRVVFRRVPLIYYELLL